MKTTNIEAALDGLLRASIADDEAQSQGSCEVVLLTAEQLQYAAKMSRLDVDVADLTRRPIRAACRQAIRKLGQHLHANAGGTEGMCQVLERVADIDPPRYAYRASIMDHAWDGIGTDADKWWC